VDDYFHMVMADMHGMRCGCAIIKVDGREMRRRVCKGTHATCHELKRHNQARDDMTRIRSGTSHALERKRHVKLRTILLARFKRLI